MTTSDKGSATSLHPQTGKAEAQGLETNRAIS
jgi:hypothetical protein